MIRSFLSAYVFLWALSGSARAGQHVIVISCDGMRPDVVELLGAEHAPNLHRLVTEGASTANARTDFDYSVTLPNHTCMITGRRVVGEDGHGWKSNSTPKIGQMLHRNKKAYVRGMFCVAHDHGLRTALFASKTKFKLYDLSYNDRSGAPDTTGEDNGRDKIDVFGFEEDTEIMVGKFLEASADQPFNLAMLHLRDPDSAGHSQGWDLTVGSIYRKAIERIDAHVGKILAAIEADERLRGKTTLVITADHGGSFETKTHTRATDPRNYTIPFYVWGPAVAAGADLYEINPSSRTDPGTSRPDYGADIPIPIRNGDAGNLALRILGLPAIEGSTINAAQDLLVSPVAQSAEPAPEAGGRLP